MNLPGHRWGFAGGSPAQRLDNGRYKKPPPELSTGARRPVEKSFANATIGIKIRITRVARFVRPYNVVASHTWKPTLAMKIFVVFFFFCFKKNPRLIHIPRVSGRRQYRSKQFSSTIPRCSRRARGRPEIRTSKNAYESDVR